MKARKSVIQVIPWGKEQMRIVCPKEWSPQYRARIRNSILRLTYGQQVYCAHLLRSWRAQTLLDVNRAVKKAQEQR